MSMVALVAAVVLAPLAFLLGVMAFVVGFSVVGQRRSAQEPMSPRQAQVFAGREWTLGARCRGLLVETREQAYSFVLQGLHAMRLLPRIAPATSGTPVVLLHGFWENAGNLWPLGRRLRARGFRVFPLDLPSTVAPIGSNVEFLRLTLERIRASTGERRVALIGHSMGGLISRRYAHQHADHDVAVVITVASPHGGTLATALLRLPSVIELRRGGKHATRLPPTAVGPVPVHCMVAAQDHIVAPAWSAVLESEGECVLIDEPVGHVGPLSLESTLPHFERWLLEAGVERIGEGAALTALEPDGAAAPAS